jgi:alpha-galactosidase
MYTTSNPMTLVMIGAGSAKFTLGLVKDLIADGREYDLRLVDIEPYNLEVAWRLAQRLVEDRQAPIKVTYSLERCDLLPGADVVVTTIGVGSRPAWEQDVFIPRQFGIYYPVGDTSGPGGISRALRMIPPMVAIANDVVRLCPQALFINYANPMSCVCRAIRKATSAQVVGLCIGVHDIHNQLCRFLGIPPEEAWSAAIGVNHFTWFTELRHQGRDAWPTLRQKMAQEIDLQAPGALVWNLFDAFDAFPAVGDAHVSEFFPGAWHKSGGYFGKTLGLDGVHNFEEDIIACDDRTFARMADIAFGRLPVDAPREGEGGEHSQLLDILNAVWRDENRFFSVNLPNAGQAGNLPAGAILEATTLVNASGFHPLSFGLLPPGIAATLQRVIGVQELTVDAALRGDRGLFVQALLADGDVQTSQQASTLADALLEAQRQWLPDFYG